MQSKNSIRATGREYLHTKRGIKAKYAVLTALALSIVIFLAISVLAVLNEGLPKFVGTIASINPLYYSLALLFVFLSDLVGFPKWNRFIKKLGIKIHTKKNLAIYMSMFSMDITPGRFGRAIASSTLNKVTGMRFAKTFPAVIADIFTDFVGFVSVVLLSSFLVRKYLPISIGISVILLLPFVFIYTRKPYEYLKKKLGGRKRFEPIFEFGDMYFTSHKLLDKKTYAYAMLFTIPAVIFSGLSLYFVILSFGINLSISFLPTLLFIFTSSLLLGMITGVPGTLGVADAAMLSYLVAFFPSMGITFGIASAITIFFRIAAIWFDTGVGTIFLLYTFRYWKPAEISVRTKTTKAKP